MAPYEVLYGRKCRTPLCWTKVSEAKFVGPELLRQTEEKVKIIKERLKATTDRQKSYADLRRKDIEFTVGDKVFDPSHVIPAETIDAQSDLTYEEEPVKILAREMKELRNKKIPLVKVLWRNHKVEEAT
ncbi:uncharacterized protein LOC110607332 [Manihot esculenta]|uniref:uncharacterized protein LOC110607332 n=1 Tax=Manihot esculenta TaxID=3983 RepID=UPI001CC4EF10|nr:uncharacterized protein LOC110607332 [Manihot esculenta]